MKAINSILLLCLLVSCSNMSGLLKWKDESVPKHNDEIESYSGNQTLYHPFMYQDMDEVERKPSLLLKILKSKPMIPLIMSLFVGNAFKSSFSCFVSKLGLKNSVVALILGKLGFENTKKFFDSNFKCP